MFAKVENSPRLRSTLRALRQAGQKGLTGLELSLQAGVLNPGEPCSELRKNGYQITVTEEAKSTSGRRVFRYKLIGEPHEEGR